MTDTYIVTREKDGKALYLYRYTEAEPTWTLDRAKAYPFRLERAAQRQAREWKGTVEIA